jgi:hypothetical protein
MQIWSPSTLLMSFYPLLIFQSSLTIAKIVVQLLVNPLQILLPFID